MVLPLRVVVVALMSVVFGVGEEHDGVQHVSAMAMVASAVSSSCDGDEGERLERGELRRDSNGTGELFPHASAKEKESGRCVVESHEETEEKEGSSNLRWQRKHPSGDGELRRDWIGVEQDRNLPIFAKIG